MVGKQTDSKKSVKLSIAKPVLPTVSMEAALKATTPVR